MTLIVGGFTDKVNRKNLILFSCLVASILSCLNGIATELWHLNFLRMVNGALASLFQPASYSLINDYFPKSSRTKAFFMYQIFGTMADVINYMTINLITLVGWRNSYFICGGLGIVTSLVGLTFMREPPNSVRIMLEKQAEEQEAEDENGA